MSVYGYANYNIIDAYQKPNKGNDLTNKSHSHFGWYVKLVTIMTHWRDCEFSEKCILSIFYCFIQSDLL